MKYKSIVLASIFTLGFIARLYPYIVTLLPFSPDAWPLIRDMYILANHSPISLSSQSFDKYNNYWPGVILSSVIYNRVIGYSILRGAAFIVPFESSLGLIILYALLRRINIRWDLSLIATALVGVFYPHFFFYSGVTKETYAFPLYITFLL